MTGWPRKLVNFPIILLATVAQYVVALALLLDPGTRFATQVFILYLVFPALILPYVIFGTATLAAAAFSMPTKIGTLLLLTPQQLLLWLSAGSSFRTILVGHYADGVIRSTGHLTSDQVYVILIAVFHSWAAFLILVHGED